VIATVSCSIIGTWVSLRGDTERSLMAEDRERFGLFYCANAENRLKDDAKLRPFL